MLNAKCHNHTLKAPEFLNEENFSKTLLLTNLSKFTEINSSP